MRKNCSRELKVAGCQEKCNACYIHIYARARVRSRRTKSDNDLSRQFHVLKRDGRKLRRDKSTENDIASSKRIKKKARNWQKLSLRNSLWISLNE